MKYNPLDLFNRWNWADFRKEAHTVEDDLDILISEKIAELVDLVPDELSFGDETGEPWPDMGTVPLDNNIKRVILSECIREDKSFQMTILDHIERGLKVMREQPEPVEADEEE